MSKFSTLISAAKKGVKKFTLSVRRNAPEILAFSGAAVTVIGTVGACKATRKADMVIAEHKANLEHYEECVGKPMSDGDTYTEEYKKEDVRNDKIKTAVTVVKIFAPAVLTIAVGLGTMLFSHKLLKDRLNGALTALNATAAAFNEYRRRVIAEIGAEKEAELYYGDYAKLKPSSNRNPLTSTGPLGQFCWVFDESNPNFTNNNALNAAFLSKTMAYLNVRYRQNGYLWLEEALDELGFRPTCKNGHWSTIRTHGWLEGMGDNCVDFGYICEDFVQRAASHEFDNMDAIAVVLDFNVDGDLTQQLDASVNERGIIYTHA